METKKSKHIVGWIFAVLFILGGLGNLISGSILSGLFYIVGGAILLPPVREKLNLKTWLAVVIAIVALVVGAMFAPANDADTSSAQPDASDNTTAEETAAAPEEEPEQETAAEPEQPAEEEPEEEPAAPEEEPEQQPEDPQEEEPAEEPEAPEEPVIPDTVVYTGSGDDVLVLDPFDGVYMFYISGNSAGRHFSVTAYDQDNDYVDLLVNTTEPYSGITIDPEQLTTTLEINAEGDWTVEVRSVYTATSIGAGETVTGSGDDVLLVTSSGSTASISGNEAERHFAVVAYGVSRSDLLVNETEAYDGTVMLRDDPVIVAVTAVGDWSITFND